MSLEMHLIREDPNVSENLLSVNNLAIDFVTKSGQQRVVDSISFKVFSGETFALAGESGSGKSITALSVLRLLPDNARISSGEINLNGLDLTATAEVDLCALRGSKVAMIFQEPMTSLNPVMTIGDQVAEAIRVHFDLSPDEIKQQVLSLLQQVEIPDTTHRYHDYPHQLSGGQRQRVMIAMALAGKPELLIADEPTTALDVTTQAQILSLLKKIQQERNMGLWLISHDLALISNVADRIAVMQKGKIVEYGASKAVFTRPQHAYTQSLLEALPRLDHYQQSVKETSAPLLKVENFKVYYPIKKGLLKRVVDHVKAVDDVSFVLDHGKTLALVGESGCGKTTLGKALINLIPAFSGNVNFSGVKLSELPREELRKQRSQMQIIFQDPYSSMNPRMLVGDIIDEGMKALFPGVPLVDRRQKTLEILEQVGISKDAAKRYPHEFSGGQRQRICIARALAVDPKLIICDEPTSALDVSVQAQVIELLKSLQKEKGLSYLFISHDFAVVSEIADEIAVMKKGRLIEHGPVQQVLFQPSHPYTQQLLKAVPKLTLH